MKISILTLGCRTNQAESQGFLQEALSNGHFIVELKDNPDICIINTCSVTSKADSQSRQTILKALKHSKKVIVTGCYIHLNRNEFKNLDRVLVFDNNDKSSINKYLNESSLPKDKDFYPNINVTRPIIKIQEGCNDNCSYCSIINARGRAKSVDKKTIINNIKKYADAGFPEVVLSGTNIGQYGIDFPDNIDIYSLISEILIKTNINKIRISSIEVKYISNQLVELFKDNRMCKHLHIPLQSGDDTTLKYMNRPYRTAEFENKINYIRSINDNISIGTDIIVGFPTEKHKEFENSFNFIKKIGFSYLHVFPFSKRKKTLANDYTFSYKPQELIIRLNIMKELSSLLKSNFIKSQLNKNLDFIIEKKSGNKYFGTTDNYIKAVVSGNDYHKEKSIVKINLKEYIDDTPIGICIF